MSITAIKTEVVRLLNTLTSPGQVEDFPGAELDAEVTGTFTGFYTSVIRNGVTQRRRTMGGSGAGKMDRSHRLDIDVYLPMDVSGGVAASANEATFDARVDAILHLLSDAPGLGGLVGRSDPPEAMDDPTGIRFYRGVVQCRYRRIRWELAENSGYDGRG